MPFNFRLGADEAQKDYKEGSSAGGKVRFFGLDDGERLTVRMVSEYNAWISVSQHTGAPTKSKPADFEGTTWPSAMTAVCQNDKAFSDGQGHYAPGYGDCRLCKSEATNAWGKPVSKTQARVWALASIREEVKDGDVRIGFTDKVVEISGAKGEEKKHGRDIVVINMGWKNFFSSLNGFKFVYGSVCDRDYMITRSGEGRDTDYQFIPHDPLPGYKPGADWPYDEECAKQELVLAEIVAERSSTEYYDKFFGDGTTSGKATGDASSVPTTSTSASVAEDAMDTEKLEAMKARVQSRYGVQATS